MNKSILCLFFLLPCAHAERADSYQRTVIQSRESSSNMVSKVTTLVGNVEIHRGTMAIHAEHALLTEDDQGYQRLVMTTRPGEKLVSFRQKRDGANNQWMEGEAEQVIYDEKNEVLDLISRARARRTTEGDVTDEVIGEHIIYKAREEQYVVTQLPAKNTSGDRRGTIILQPAYKNPQISTTESTLPPLPQ